MSAITFKVRNNGQYKDVEVYVYGNCTDIGLCDEVESEAIADSLRSAADDLYPIEQAQTDAYAEGRKDEREAVSSVLGELESYLEAQDALDNREYAGINGEDYFVLLRRRNTARGCLDAAIASVESKQ